MEDIKDKKGLLTYLLFLIITGVATHSIGPFTSSSGRDMVGLGLIVCEFCTYRILKFLVFSFFELSLFRIVILLTLLHSFFLLFTPFFAERPFAVIVSFLLLLGFEIYESQHQEK